MTSGRPLIAMDEFTTTMATVAAYFKITLRRWLGTEAVRASLYLSFSTKNALCSHSSPTLQSHHNKVTANIMIFRSDTKNAFDAINLGTYDDREIHVK